MDLRDYLKILQKRWWIIVLVAVIAAGSAYGFSKLQDTVYRSAIKLTVEPSRASDYGQTLAIKNVLRNYAELLRARKMAQRVIDTLQLDIKPEALLAKLAVDPNEADLTIQIEVRDHSGGNAQRIAQAYAELFVNQRQIANLERDQTDRILTSIVDDAGAPEIYSPKTSINVLAGGVLGGLLGLIILFVLEWLESDVVRSGEDVERYAGVPVIGAIPTIGARQSRGGMPGIARLAFWKRA
ncbi:MAG: hypothetical protein HZB53_12220 [Chloroflexi bacterium]|nr:hypothetical protein [Chloroflexota bacterium]